MNKTDQQWKQELTPEQYKVLRKSATEAPFTGELLHNKADGKYICAGCGTELFVSVHKFDSGSGWPSFYDVVNTKAVRLIEDRTLGMRRVEAQCEKCGGHLGHVFNDAFEQPTGTRFCINSCALDFKPETKKLI